MFPRQQFFIFRNEDYSKNINGTLREVFKFLDIGTYSLVECVKDATLLSGKYLFLDMGSMVLSRRVGHNRKRSIQSTNADQKSIERVFSISICYQLQNLHTLKHVTYASQTSMCFDPHLSYR